jgi:beta-glucosidase
MIPNKLLLLCLKYIFVLAAGSTYVYPFQDPSLPFETRAEDLVSRLTLDEKGSQLGHYDLQTRKSLGRANSPSIPRLNVSGYNYGMECNSGIIVGYPTNVGMAATFNRTALFHSGRGTGLGLRANTLDSPGQYPGYSCWSPMINLIRHPLWGRNHEGYGEDPFLSGELAYNVIRGMQGDDKRYALVNAGVKHFAAFDGPGNGGDAIISDADLVQTYLVPFSKAFQAGSLSTMCTYAGLNGVSGCQNPKLMQTWLRERMNFSGYVVSDQGAIHDATAAINAGCDVEDGFGMYSKLPALVSSGEVLESTLDRALARLVLVRMKHGEFDPEAMVPYRNKSRYGKGGFPLDYYNNVSLDVTRQTITLLKNQDGTLPLKPAARVAVVGIAHSMSAGYNTAPRLHSTVPEALEQQGFIVSYAQGCIDAPRCTKYNSTAVTAAIKGVAVALVFIGRGGDEGEGSDSANMTLPGRQVQLVQDVMASEAKVVLVLLNCNPLDLTFAAESEKVAAIVHAYYPQNFGANAIADVLAGVVSPAGRLPYTWPKDLTLAGDIGNYTMAGTQKTYRYRTGTATNNTLWSFGYGLSYTGFAYSDLSISPSTVTEPCENVTVRVKVRNTGKVDSDEVVQVYASWKLTGDRDGLSAPSRQLVGFERVFVKAGATAVVSIVLSPAQMAVLNSTGSFVPSGHIGPVAPCDGNTTDNSCGLLKNYDFYQVPGAGVKSGTISLDECCAACRATPANSSKACVAWTLRGDDASCKNRAGGCDCYLHKDLSGARFGQSGLTSGVVFDRLPPFPPCSSQNSTKHLPVWTRVPATMELSVGGQQPDQPITAPSNVLSAWVALRGRPTPLSTCA